MKVLFVLFVECNLNYINSYLIEHCFTATPTPAPMYQVPYQCSFEIPDIWCGIMQSANDQFDWTWKQGPTQSDNTGPSSAFDGLYYIYVEVSDARDGDNAR